MTTQQRQDVRYGVMLLGLAVFNLSAAALTWLPWWLRLIAVVVASAAVVFAALSFWLAHDARQDA